MRAVATSLLFVVLAMTCDILHAASFKGLGDFAGGAFDSVPWDVSANGSVIVGYGSSTSGTQAFRWTSGGGMVALGDLPGGGSYSVAFGVSLDGSVIVGDSASSLGFEAFRWTSGTGMQGLGDLPESPFGSVARAVSANGSVIVGSGNGLGGDKDAFRLEIGGVLVNLGGVSATSAANDVSADGAVVVGQKFNHAHRWTTADGIVDLGTLPGDFFSEALGVSADGTVVVGESRGAFSLEAFRWTSAGGMIGLGQLPGGGFLTAFDTSGDGSVIVGHGFSASQDEAIVWDSAHGTRTLRSALLDLGQGAAVAGWTLEVARAVSMDGKVIVGFGTNPAGNREAWRADITPVPEPSSIVLGLLAGVGLLASRRFWRR